MTVRLQWNDSETSMQQQHHLNATVAAYPWNTLPTLFSTLCLHLFGGCCHCCHLAVTAQFSELQRINPISDSSDSKNNENFFDVFCVKKVATRWGRHNLNYEKAYLTTTLS